MVIWYGNIVLGILCLGRGIVSRFALPLVPKVDIKLLKEESHKKWCALLV